MLAELGIKAAGPIRVARQASEKTTAHLKFGVIAVGMAAKVAMFEWVRAEVEQLKRPAVSADDDLPLGGAEHVVRVDLRQLVVSLCRLFSANAWQQRPAVRVS